MVGLAFAEGGFGLEQRHVAGLAIWLVVVALLALGLGGRALLEKPFFWAAGLIFGLAIWSAISSLWSGSVELSVAEADRVLVYLGVFLATFLIAQTDQKRQRFAEGIAIGLIMVSLVALASRLLPFVFNLSTESAGGSRLRWPLGYWNALGLFMAMAGTLSLWMSRRSLVAALRWAAAGLLPAIIVGLYVTYSRGGIGTFVIGAIVVMVLSHDRLWVLGTVLAGAIGALPAIFYIHGHFQIAEVIQYGDLAGQGVMALVLTVVGIAFALAAAWGLRRLERDGGRRTAGALAISRDPRTLRGIAIAAVIVLIILGALFGSTLWHKFTSTSEIRIPTVASEKFGEVSSGGRTQFWQAAWEGFEENPLVGHGAGTYQFSWDQLRTYDTGNTQAHSLYLQALDELGIVGGALAIGMVGLLLWTGFAAWRNASGRVRELYGALFAISVIFAIGALYDWFWQVTVLGAIFFLATGSLVAARCAQLVRARQDRGAGTTERRRFGLALVGIGVAWLTMLALIGPLLVNHEIKESNHAIEREEFEDARNHAETAKSIEPWAASPYVQLGLLAQLQGQYPEAVNRFQQAIDREDDNWTLYYLRAKAEHQAGQEKAAHASLAEANRLNPLETCLSEGFEACG